MSLVPAPAPGKALVGARIPPTAGLADDQQPRWWRVPMVWVVIAGPLSVVIASLLTAVIAWRHIDPVIIDASSGHVIGRAGDEAATPQDPNNPLAPAVRARNHSPTARGSNGTHDAGRP